MEITVTLHRTKIVFSSYTSAFMCYVPKNKLTSNVSKGRSFYSPRLFRILQGFSFSRSVAKILLPSVWFHSVWPPGEKGHHEISDHLLGLLQNGFLLS